MFKGFKISIRLSIITLFVLLLSVIGFTIITINYVALNKILSSSAKTLIEQTSLLVKERVHMYLRPLSHDLVEISTTLNRGIVDPNNGQRFDRFLTERIRYKPEIFMIYYGTVKGDFYGVDHETPNVIGLTHVLNSVTPSQKMRYELDQAGNIINTNYLSKPYDPRVRPWYQQAVKAGKPIWTDIYLFYVFGKSDYLVPGITAAAPIYDGNKKLTGILALDLTVDGIQHFIQELQVTENAMIYITNEKQQVIAYKNPFQTQDIRGEKLTPELIKKFNIPLVSFIRQNTKPLVSSYQYQGKQFFLAYQPITETITDPWNITIIVPAEDVLAPLEILSIRALLLTFIVLFIGALIARYISKKISHPIIELAQEAEEITKLNLRPRPLLKTMIKEISYMDKSLSNMRTSLASFQRYIPSSLVKKLISSGKIAQVGGQNQTITVLFSDIKDFTKLAEETDPQQLMTYLSDYFQSMTEAVISHHGTVDKYIGDAVMAFWNAPFPDKKHAFHACQTAVNMLERIEQLNSNNRQYGLPEYAIRIGINSGEAVVGNVGSEDRLNFTALGDTVNLASRLEVINKTYHSQIIVSEATYQKVENKFSFRLLDEVAVRGKRKSTAIYELLVSPNVGNLEQYKKEFKMAFTSYQRGEWENSLLLFKKLTPAFPGDQLANIYINRCQQLIISPPVAWDGIWRVEEGLI
ncbi:adenylate/guanylate cyclase domain-containing protein [Legionella maioricensis]|uniref:Adenylate/guanylate cyclase domain-containing protein n=1 Tax=Legionella maioricensis TaxID=2896528 RepID=A0A9X2CZD5_9GAMM|nr:adenylate/guanylate cyclase domain-containing protein [Legionella maioricensis]MCL9683536.1 adenylate/guanylate cyclase domain-containing protein [Legionella maioricensis]MCL9686835.1 adenylate/guanylate cyclase domain-containing protein [Legionella maioricensis]